MRYPNYRRIKTTDVRNEFGWIVDHVAHGKERVILERRGRSLAAIIPMEDLRFLEAAFSKVEDALDIANAEKAFAQDPIGIPYEQIRKELGLDGTTAQTESKSRQAAAAAAHRRLGSRGQSTVGVGRTAKAPKQQKAARKAKSV